MKCSRTRLEFKDKISDIRDLFNNECSRTRLEFKESNFYTACYQGYNAVAPDWNLKIGAHCTVVSATKCSRTRLEFKVHGKHDYDGHMAQCSRTRLEFKVWRDGKY